MKIIAVYDCVDGKSTKAKKVLQKYLFAVQFSVFEGDITDAQIKKMINEFKKFSNEKDSLLIYKCGFGYEKEIIGKDKSNMGNII